MFIRLFKLFTKRSAVIEAVKPMTQVSPIEEKVNNKVKEPSWLIKGREFIGLTEVKGSKHAPDIVQFWKDIKRGGIKDDETPWCAAYVGAVLERCNIRSTRFEGASSYLKWGEQLTQPVLGCVVVFTRQGGNHVGFVVGVSETGNLLVLGGNQSDAVNIKEFSRERVSGYRYPTIDLGCTELDKQPLPTLSKAELSSKES